MGDRQLTTALLRWQRAAGPFWSYVCALPFLSEMHPARTATRSTPSGRWLIATCKQVVAPGTAVFVDLPPTQVLSEAPKLNALGLYVVPIVQRWCAPRCVLPAERLHALLVSLAPLLEPPQRPRGVVFL